VLWEVVTPIVDAISSVQSTELVANVDSEMSVVVELSDASADR
jgi:hypothetical protein